MVYRIWMSFGRLGFRVRGVLADAGRCSASGGAFGKVRGAC